MFLLYSHLRPRTCFIKNKINGGVIGIETIDQPSPHRLAEMDEDGFIREVAECEIGKNYLRDRKQLETEYNARREELTKVEEPKTFREPRR